MLDPHERSRADRRYRLVDVQVRYVLPLPTLQECTGSCFLVPVELWNSLARCSGRNLEAHHTCRCVFQRAADQAAAAHGAT